MLGKLRAAKGGPLIPSARQDLQDYEQRALLGSVQAGNDPPTGVEDPLAECQKKRDYTIWVSREAVPGDTSAITSLCCSLET